MPADLEALLAVADVWIDRYARATDDGTVELDPSWFQAAHELRGAILVALLCDWAAKFRVLH